MAQKESAASKSTMTDRLILGLEDILALHSTILAKHATGNGPTSMNTMFGGLRSSTVPWVWLPALCLMIGEQVTNTD